MKYYYGNSVKEALSNEPVTIRSTKQLQQYQECYWVVIPEDEAEEMLGHEEEIDEMAEEEGL